jgi:hypothetical protein
MHDAPTPDEPRAPRRRLGPVTALVAGSLAGLVLGLGGTASAQTAQTPVPSPSASATPEAGTEQEDAARDPLCDEDEAGATAEPSSSGDSAA